MSCSEHLILLFYVGENARNQLGLYLFALNSFFCGALGVDVGLGLARN